MSMHGLSQEPEFVVSSLQLVEPYLPTPPALV